jgi:hypothetical protein
MDGANIDHRLAACVGDALVRKSHDPQHDESDPNKRYRIDTHKIPSFVKKPKRLVYSSSLNDSDHWHHQGNDQIASLNKIFPCLLPEPGANNPFPILQAPLKLQVVEQKGAAHNCSFIGMENSSRILSTKEREFQAL